MLAAIGILQSAIDELNRKSVDEVYEGRNTPPESSAILKVINLAEHKLRKVIRKTPKLEKEVQDCFESLLVGGDFTYKREFPKIEYSSKGYIPDFTFPRINLALDIKLCNRANREKKIIAEINDDIMAYKTQFANLLFVVYDVGHIRDRDVFVKTFQDTEGVIVSVIKH